MRDFIKCFLGIHKFEVLETQELKNYRGDTLGKIFIMKCENCGEIREHIVYTLDTER